MKMNVSALIIVNMPARNPSDMPRAFLKAGGLTLLERQLRQLKRKGVENTLLVSDRYLDDLAGQIAKFRKAPNTLDVISLKDFNPGTHWKKNDKILILEEGVLIDDRILETVLKENASSSPRVAFFPKDGTREGEKSGLTLKARNMEMVFASAALVKGDDLIKAENDAGFSKSPLKAILKQAIGPGKATLSNIEKIDTYQQDRRRKVPILWHPVSEKKETGKATRRLIGMAQKGVLDWPARWIHPFFENFIVEHVCKTFLTPNMVTVITSIAGFGITYLFAIGENIWAIAGALVVGVLDGVDGKLARTKMLQSKIGELEHVMDKIVEYSWYLGMAYYLSQAEGNSLPWALAVMIIFFAWTEAAQGEFYRRLSGKQLDDAGKFERIFRIFSARRNTIIWLLIPFALTNTWLFGFWCVAVFTAVTFLVLQVRFFIRVHEYTSEKSREIKENFKKTAYF